MHRMLPHMHYLIHLQTLGHLIRVEEHRHPAIERRIHGLRNYLSPRQQHSFESRHIQPVQQPRPLSE